MHYQPEVRQVYGITACCGASPKRRRSCSVVRRKEKTASSAHSRCCCADLHWRIIAMIDRVGNERFGDTCFCSRLALCNSVRLAAYAYLICVGLVTLTKVLCLRGRTPALMIRHQTALICAASVARGEGPVPTAVATYRYAIHYANGARRADDPQPQYLPSNETKRSAP